jgi:LytS/YehU family sensor histidine kinase
MPTVVVPLEIGRRRFAAQIAVDTLIVDVELPIYVLRVFIRNVSHGFPGKKVEWNVKAKRAKRNGICSSALKNNAETFDDCNREQHLNRCIRRGREM